MPIFGFRKQRFHPHLALAQRFLISGSLLIGTNPLQIFHSNRSVDATPLSTGRPLRFDRTPIAQGRRGTIELTPGRGINFSRTVQHLALGAAILIGLRFIVEVGGRPDLMLLFPIRQRDVGADAMP